MSIVLVTETQICSHKIVEIYKTRTSHFLDQFYITTYEFYAIYKHFMHKFWCI
jgi:hypothetical protein